MVAIIPAILEAEIGRITVSGQPQQNVSKTPCQPVSWMWLYQPCDPSYAGGLGRMIEI
jgi:hypothetical protein